MSVARADLAGRITVSPEAVAGFCRRNHIRKLSLFGSVLRDDFRPESDVDVLVEFETGKAPDFLRLHRNEGRAGHDARPPGRSQDP